MSNMPKDGKDLQVYAEIANRIGVLSKQYERLSKKSLKYKIYDVTLHICLLQTILTYVIEQLYGRFGFMEWSKGFFSNNIRNKTESRRIV